MLLGLFFVIFTQGCASVGAVIEGGKELATNTVDVVVGTASDVAVSVAEVVIVLVLVGSSGISGNDK